MNSLNSKVLFITNADMTKNSGDVILVCRRAETMFLMNGIETVILTASGKDTIIQKGYRGVYFSSVERISYEVITEKIELVKPRVIVFFGARIYVYTKKIKEYIKQRQYKVKTFCDIQGVPEEIIEFLPLLQKCCRYPNFYAHKKLIQYGLSNVDSAFVVSDEMINYCNKLLRGKNKVDYYKVRCGVDSILDTNTKMVWRSQTRMELGIGESKTVFVFSGYRKPWQKIDYTIAFFKNVDKKMDNAHFCFFCNVDIEFENRLKEEFPRGNYTVKFLQKDEYFKYLVACDIGVLFRDNNTTNCVAFPNKFSDYINAGLIVALNSFLIEPNLILKKYDLPYINADRIPMVSEYVYANKLRTEKLEEFYACCEKVCESELTYHGQLKSISFFERSQLLI